VPDEEVLRELGAFDEEDSADKDVAVAATDSDPVVNPSR